MEANFFKKNENGQGAEDNGRVSELKADRFKLFSRESKQVPHRLEFNCFALSQNRGKNLRFFSLIY